MPRSIFGHSPEEENILRSIRSQIPKEFKTRDAEIKSAIQDFPSALRTLDTNRPYSVDDLVINVFKLRMEEGLKDLLDFCTQWEEYNGNIVFNSIRIPDFGDLETLTDGIKYKLGIKRREKKSRYLGHQEPETNESQKPIAAPGSEAGKAEAGSDERAHLTSQETEVLKKIFENNQSGQFYPGKPNIRNQKLNELWPWPKRQKLMEKCISLDIVRLTDSPGKLEFTEKGEALFTSENTTI